MDTKSATGPFANLPPVLQLLHEAKAAQRKTFAELAEALGKAEIWVAALFYGQAKPSPQDLQTLSSVLQVPLIKLRGIGGLGKEWWPYRGLGGGIPTDPLIYRLYEGVLVYGHPIKAVIHEKFNGDGIMSMIDCRVSVEKKEDPKGDRVVLTFDGKFLPYAVW
ncbi:Cyanase [Dacryopinax primogenitus]|uniref:Cyanate hydratase n=1 Tax=Dacryopinax primogenitus (strain DJM 731) TaxID=1858805 RepID=M5G8P8_DACPD|nr:Cyanase [Dacryopinax primogenitus]EJU04555.1 Cyanase [Dacryopinax primogenitus]